MDRYYQNSSNNSPGFVYFNQNTNQENENKADTADFLGFGETEKASPQQNRFNPTHYSSPQSRNYRGKTRNYPPSNRKYQRWSGSYRSFNSSNNSSFNRSSSLNEENKEAYIANFVHPSFLEDPWAQLEKNLLEKSQNSQAEEPQSSKTEET